MKSLMLFSVYNPWYGMVPLAWSFPQVTLDGTETSHSLVSLPMVEVPQEIATDAKEVHPPHEDPKNTLKS